MSWKPSSPGAGAVGEGEPVPLGLLPVALGPVVLAGDGCCVGRVVHRRGAGQGLDHGLPGPRELAGPAQPALLDQEVGGRGRLGVLDAGQRLDLVQHRGQHLALLHGDRAGAQRVQHARVAAQRGRLAQPGAAVGAGEPQPVGQPPLGGRAPVRAFKSRDSTSASSTVCSATVNACRRTSNDSPRSTSPSASCHTDPDAVAAFSSRPAAARTSATTGGVRVVLSMTRT